MQLINQLNKSIKQLKKAIQNSLDSKNTGLTTDQWLVLNAVDEIGEPKQSDIAELLGKETASVSRIIDILESKNLLKRGNIQSDRRSFIISVTVEGGRLLKVIKPSMEEINEKLDSIDLREIVLTLNDISTIDK